MINFFVKKPIFSFVLMIVALLIGFVAITNTPRQLMPDIDAPVISVITVYPGASSEEMMEKVTEPLESSLSTVGGLDSIQSTTSVSSSNILMVFDFETDIDKVELDINSAVSKSNLPTEANAQVLKFNTSDLPIIQAALSTKTLTNDALKDAEEIKSELAKIDGVASVELSNSNKQSMNVLLDKQKMDDVGLSATTVINAIKAENFSIPITELTDSNDETTTARFEEELTESTIRNLVVGFSQEENKQILLSDISNIDLVYETKNQIEKLNNKEAVTLSITQKETANTAEVSTLVMEKLNELVETDYTEFDVHVLLDQGEYTNQAINSVLKSVLIGGLFAIIVLIAFLRSVPASVIISISIPFSLFVTFIFFYYFELSLNIMTLGGLALAVGMLVDNAIVVIENIYRHLGMGKNKQQAAIDGTKEVASAIIASTLTTVAVFLPLTFASGIVKILFTDFALTVSVALLASLIVALTVIPTLSALLLKPEKIKVKKSKLSFFRHITAAALKRRILTIFLITVLFIGGILGIATSGMELFPPSDQGTFSITLEDNEKSNWDEESFVSEMNKIESYLSEQDEIDNFLLSYNKDELTNATFSVVMKKINERNYSTAEYIKVYEDDLSNEMDSFDLTISELQSAGMGSSGTVTFSIDNKEHELLLEDADKILTELNILEETVTAETNLSEQKTEFVYSFDKDALVTYGLSAIGVSSEINQAVNPTKATTIESDENGIIDVNVQLNPMDVNSIEKLNNFSVTTPSGEKINLNSIASVNQKETAPSIIRTNGAEKIDFTVAYESGTELSVFNKKITDAIDELDLNENTEVNLTGDVETLQNSMKDLALMLVISILLIYLVISAQFESFKKPMVIMVSIPLIVIGIGASLVLTNTAFSVIAMLGVIILTGIVVNNAIVLIDYVLQLKNKGMDTLEALITAVEVRTRPILITTTTTVLGLLPVAFALGEGAELQQPMAIVVIGGLLSSTFLTLVAIPVVFSLFDKQFNQKRKQDKMISKDDYFIIKKEDLDTENQEKIKDIINKK